MKIYKLEYFFRSDSNFLNNYDYIRNIDKSKYIIINLDNITTITLINQIEGRWPEHFSGVPVSGTLPFSIVQMNGSTFFYIKEDSFNSLVEHINSLKQ
jgi:hypothetical protein